MKATFLAILALCFPAALAAQDEPPGLTCAPGVYVTLAEGKGFNLARACELYADLIRHHVANAQEVPRVAFHLVANLDKPPDGADLSSTVGRPMRVVAYHSRARGVKEIWVAEDKPEHYVVALLDGLDYENRLYMPRAIFERAAQQALAELRQPELRQRFHATVSAGELRRP